MLASILLAVSVSTAGWSLASFLRRRTAIAAGAAVWSAVSALSWAASVTGFTPWLEGGYGMAVLSVVGGYAIGAAVASRWSESRGPKIAAAVGALVTVLAGLGFHAQALRVIEEALERVDPAEVELIRAAGRGEALRLVEWAGLLGLVTVLLLVRGGPVARLGEGERRSLDAEARQHDDAQLRLCP